MALTKIKKPRIEVDTLVSTDTGNSLSVGTDGGLKVTGGSQGGSIFAGTCSTASATAAKVVDCPDFSLSDGAIIDVLFDNSSYVSGSDPLTLNVNNTGAKNVYLSRYYDTDKDRYVGVSVPNFFWDYHSHMLFRYLQVMDCYVTLLSPATTIYYGLTKLDNSINSTSQGESATPYAVYQVNQKVQSKLDCVLSQVFGG